MSRPYQQRRAFATCRKIWPDLKIICAAQSMSLEAYFQQIGDVKRVVNMLVGDTQRVWVYAERGHSLPQHVPSEVHEAYDRLVMAGFTDRLI